MAVVASKLAVASWRPPGAQLQHRMVRACASSKMALHTQSSLPGHFLVQSLTVLSPLQLARVSPASSRCPSQSLVRATRLPQVILMESISSVGTRSMGTLYRINYSNKSMDESLRGHRLLYWLL